MPTTLKKCSMNKENLYSSVSMSKKQQRLRDLLATRLKMDMEKARARLKLDDDQLQNGDKKQGLKPADESLKRKREKAQAYKNLFKLAGKKAKLSQGGDDVSKIDERIVKSSCLGSKLQRVGLSPEKGVCIGNAEAGHGSCGPPPVGEGEYETTNEMDKSTKGLHGLESPLLSHCAICMGGGELLFCSGKECAKSFHLSCFDPPLLYASPGVWHCNSCTKKKLESGVHSVSEGIESILSARDMVLDNAAMPKQKQYLVKYKSLAHVHNLWLTETQLLLEAPTLLSKFKKNYRHVNWDIEWSVPQRLIKRRPLVFSKHHDKDCCGSGDSDPGCQSEWLVKWTGLNYDHATWELDNSSFLGTPKATMLKRKFETRKYTVSRPSKKGTGELSSFPFEVPTEVGNRLLPYVNKLRDYWLRGHNAVFFDGQERIVKVIFFILSLLGNVKQPFLVVAASSALSLWEAEFSNWSSVVDTVTYKGNKDVRAVIRRLELSNEEGCIEFQVLLSSPEVIIEDLEVLGRINWEAIIIDECQRPTMHSKEIKMLAADMKLLIVSGETVDRRLNYKSVLSLVDSKYEPVDEDVDTETTIDAHALKERLSPFIVFDCKFSSPRFKEYWVPVRLSRMQVEQYCSVLHSNSTLLCSSLKRTSASSFHEILALTRKCCDHPYFVDPTLQNSYIRCNSVDPLNDEINVSGKLQLLDKILSEIKKRGLRVLVLFQSVIGSGRISIGDILDDLVHRRFGQESYARIQGDISRSKKQAALNLFNSREGGQFVCLLEYRACHPSTKLSSIDVVILFDSDWNPMNDLKALQRITFDSHCEQLRVFRLYSSSTIEEKVLVLAKQGTILDSRINNISRINSHLLLSWGASYLFAKLQSYGHRKTPEPESDIPCGRSLSDDVVDELAALLPHKNGSTRTDCSIILNVQQKEGAYPSNISLLGEIEAHSKDNFLTEENLIETEPHVFWTNLLQESDHKKKRITRPSRRPKMLVQIPDDGLEGSESENAETFSCKVEHDTNFCGKKRLRSDKKVTAKVKGNKLAAGRRNKGLSSLCEGVNIKWSSDFPSTPCIPENVSPVCDGGEEASSRENVGEIEQQSGGRTQKNDEMLNNDSSHTTQQQFGMVQRPSPATDQDQVERESLSVNLRESSSRSLMRPTAQLLIQPSTSVTGCDPVVSNLSSTNSVSQSQNNHSPSTLPVTPLVFQSSSNNPFEIELERIQKSREQATKIHHERKLNLLFECEKEILEIRQKYDALIQESEMSLLKQTEVLESDYKVVYANKLLAEILAQTYDALKAAQSKETEKATRLARILEIPPPTLLSAGKPCSTSILPSDCSGNSLGGAGLLQTPASTMPPMADPCSVGIYPTTHFSENSLVGTGLRAPAPHLRNSRPLPSVAFHNLPSFPHPLPTIPEPSLLDSSYTNSLPTESALEVPLHTQSELNSGVCHQQERVEELPELPSGFDSFPDMDFPDTSLLGSNDRANDRAN